MVSMTKEQETPQVRFDPEAKVAVARDRAARSQTAITAMLDIENAEMDALHKRRRWEALILPGWEGKDSSKEFARGSNEVRRGACRKKCRGWRRANGSSERCTRGCSTPSTTAQRLCRRSRPSATNCVRVTTAVAARSPSSDPEEDYVPATEHEVTEWMADLHEEMNAALVSGNPMQAARISGLITMRPRVSNPQRCLFPWCCNGEMICERRDSLYGCRGVVSRRRRRVSSSSAETSQQSALGTQDDVSSGVPVAPQLWPACCAQDMCERAAQIMPSRPLHS